MSYTGIHSFLDLLAHYDIGAFFGNPGTTELPLNDALIDDQRFRYVLGLHEVPVVSMADGYTQASGRVSCVNLHTCCGLGNAMGMIYNAHQEGTPLLITAGQQDRRLQLGEPVLGGDLVSVAKPWTKWAYEVQRVEDIPAALKRAVQTAVTPPRGPVFLSIPVDVQMESCEPPDLQRFGLTTPRLGTNSEAIAATVEVLAKAKRPAILAGSRVTEENGESALADLAERLGAPIYFESPTSQGRLPVRADHPLLAGPLPLWSPDIRQRLAEYDTIFVCGLNLFRLYIFFEPEFPLEPGTKIVQFDSAVTELGKNWDPDVAAWGPIDDGLGELNQALAQRLRGADSEALAIRRQETMQSLERERAEFAREFQRRADSSAGLTSQGMMQTVAAWAPDNLAVIEEAVTSTHHALTRLQKLTRPEGYFGHRGWALGWGAGCACGVQIAWPDRPVLAILGDGSTIYGLQALWSATRHELPVTFLICNNRRYQILRDGARLLQLDRASQDQFLGMDLDQPDLDFVQLAQGFGMRACRVDRSDALADALAQRATANGPQLIEVMLSDEAG